MASPFIELQIGIDGREARVVARAIEEMFVGRSTECHVVIDDPLVAACQARLVWNGDGEMMLEEVESLAPLGAAGGLRLDGQPVTAPVPVRPEQKLGLGPAIIVWRWLPKEEWPTISRASSKSDGSQNAAARLAEELSQGRYRPEGEIGRGGIGRVFEAAEKPLRRSVALKVLLESDRIGAQERFIREARITGGLQHPSIVPVHDLGVDEQGRVFYTMKRVRGMTLAQALRQMAAGNPEAMRQYGFPTLLTIFQKVCDAVAFAHSKGIVHRDLKPENIMVGDFGEVLVMDWGAAKMLSSPSEADEAIEHEEERVDPAKEAGHVEESVVTAPGSGFGTPGYMAPEQARGEAALADARTDIYALGAILYTLLTIESPEPLETTEAFEFADCSRRIKGACDGFYRRVMPLLDDNSRPRKYPHLPRGAFASLAPVVAEAMAPRQEERFQSVGDLQNQVATYQAGRAPSVENASAWKHFRLFVARHKAVSATALAAMFAVGMISAGFTYRVVRERDRTKDAQYLAENRLYYSDMMLAGRNLSEGRPQNARTLLARHRVEPSRRDLRDWEWYLLNGQSNLDLIRVDAHTGGANGLSVSADGTLIATIGEKGDVAIWKTVGLKLRMRWQAHEGRGWRVAWNATGDRLATASGNGVIRVWDVSLNTQVPRQVAELRLPDIQPGNAVETIAWEPIAGGHTRLAIGGRRPEILLWTPETEQSGSNPRTLQFTPQHGTAALCWSSDGKKIGAGLLDTGETIVIIDATTGEKLAGWHAPSGSDIFSVSFNSTNDEIVAGSKHLDVSAYRIGDANPVFVSPVHRGFVTAIACEPGSNRIASGSYDGTICINDLDNLNPGEVLASDTGNIQALAWAEVQLATGNQKILFSCSSDGTLRAWRDENSKGELFSSELGWISESRWSPDSRQLAVSTFDDDQLLRIFDRDTGHFHLVPVYAAKPFDVAWAPDGRRLAVGQMHSDSVRVIDASSGKDLAVFHLARARRVAWNPDGRYLAAGSRNQVVVWDTQARSPQPVCTIPRSGGRIAWNRDKQRLAIGTYDGAVEIWDGLKGTLMASLRPVQPPSPGELYVENEPTRMVADVAWDPYGDRLAYVTDDTVAKIVDARTGEELREFTGHTGRIQCLAWSPNGTRLATGGADGTVRLYMVDTGDEILRVPHGTGFNEITALDWSSDGCSLASGGFDGFVYAWDSRRGRDLDLVQKFEDQLAHDPRNRAHVLELAKLCARVGWASRARTLADQAQVLDPGDASITRVRDDIEATLVSLYGQEVKATLAPIHVKLDPAIVGVWRWLPRDQEVTINPDGTCSSNYNVYGEWRLLDAETRTYRIVWNNGFVDTLSLSRDGALLMGSNQHEAQQEPFYRLK